MDAWHKNKFSHRSASQASPPLGLSLKPPKESLDKPGAKGYYTNYAAPPTGAEAMHGPVRVLMPEIAQRQDRLVVGVDFGTTYSGVAAVYSEAPDDIEIIRSWPGSNGITSDKVPTELSYVDASTSMSTPSSHPAKKETPAPSPSGVKWGFQFRPEESRLRCIKLFLDRSQRLPFYVSHQDTAMHLAHANKTVVGAVTDYLTLLHAHTMDTLMRRYGESFLACTPIDWVLTCPAVWSDAAKNATVQAAARAGMGVSASASASAAAAAPARVHMISEPEAAAVWTLKVMKQHNLRVGDNFVVCDAGGGTVDLIAYKILSKQPLQFEESAVGTGALCGSAFLNYRFEEFIKGRLGEERFANMKERKAKTWQTALKYFEEFVKRNFNEEEHDEINIPFPGLPDDEEAGLDCGFLVMTAGEVKLIFDPITAEICSLVQGQVDTLRAKGGIVSGIILVGGFGQSDYLYQCLKRHFSSMPPPPYTARPTHAGGGDPLAPGEAIEVMQPVYAWTAVVRGAVLRGLEGNMVVSRKARMHYGTSYATVYDAAQHNVLERYWSPLWERWMVSDRMQWHIHKGEAINPLEPIAFHYSRNFRQGQSLVVRDDLIACPEDEPPTCFSRKLLTVCTLTTDLNAVPRSLFTRLTTTKGVEFDSLEFSLQMTVNSAGLSFELNVDGQRYGRVEAEFH